MNKNIADAKTSGFETKPTNLKLKNLKIKKKVITTKLESSKITLLDNLMSFFENTDTVFLRNSFFNKPNPSGNFGEVKELMFKVKEGSKNKVSYFGSLSDIDRLLLIK